MLDVIVDKFLLGVRDRTLDRMKLLCEIEATPALLDHPDDRAKMAFGPLQTFHNGWMAGVLHRDILSSPIGYGAEPDTTRRQMLEQLVALQRWIYAALSADLVAFAANRDWTALATVLPAGVLFGAVHALTPGHGKSVLASYLIGSRLAALRAAAVAAVLALTHVGSAVLLALIAAPLITRTLGGVGRAPAMRSPAAASLPPSAFGCFFGLGVAGGIRTAKVWRSELLRA